MDNRPIGVFDSGLGGLTVLKSLVKNFPSENFLYLGDTARLPYGSKSPATILNYLKQNVLFLIGRNVKAVVVACNSASSVLPQLEDLGVPVIGVIEAGAETAAQKSKSRAIGVLGTKTTVVQKAYVRALYQRDPKITVYQQACPLLVPLVEEGWEDDPITNLIVYRYLSPLLQLPIDTLILGCTHYPILLGAIQKVMGPHIHYVESGEAVSADLKALLNHRKLLSNQSSPPTIHALMTDVNDSFVANAQRIFAGIRQVDQVDLKW